jgi:phosphatidylglycerol---prolipoprotein diacylglyceryl transferase
VSPALISIFPPTAIQVGPLPIGLYGLGYVLGIAVLLWVSQGEARLRGFDPALVTGAVIPVAVGALIGARLYHVVDQWLYYRDHLAAIVLPPYSGLGLYGGIAGAIAGIAWHCRRHQLRLSVALDVVVPGTLLAQAIARWGNFFNQELYGPPTSLPWGVTIDCRHRIAQYPCDTFPQDTTGFHPLFLYESIWDLLGALVALWLSHRRLDRLRDGDLASFWMIWYGGGRLALESLRQGWDWTVLGIPTAMLIGAALVGLGVLTIVRRHRRVAPIPAMPD